jgi:periplasmic protein TonB
MSEAMVMDGFREFEGLLAGLLRERVEVDAPRGLEQRLLARLAQEQKEVAAAVPFAFAQRVKAPRSSWSMGGAVVAHVVVLLVLLALAKERTAPYRRTMEPVASVELMPPPPLLPAPKLAGGGGGQPDHAPVTAGHLPKFSTEQLLPPKAPPTIPPQLVVEPTVVVAQNLKMADNKMPDIGSPSSTLHGFSLGNGTGGGVGSGNGNGLGPGSGGNAGDGVMEVGGGVSAPKVIYQVDPEFSEEARRSKFSGNVYVSVIVDEQGMPTRVHIVRGIGMGLDEKAIEAVKQYRFKPAMSKGKPVKVAVDVNVQFNIY